MSFFELLAQLSFYFVQNNYVLMSVYITVDDDFKDEDVCLSSFEDYISTDSFLQEFYKQIRMFSLMFSNAYFSLVIFGLMVFF